MSKQKKIIIGVILAVIVLMAIGYAGLTSTEIKITGTAKASASQDNFKVYYTGENTVKDPESNVTVEVTNGATSANIDISGLSKKGDTAYAILEIKNGSNDVNASSITVTKNATDTEIFDIEVQMCDSTGAAISDYAVASGNTTYVKVSATLLQTPTSDAETSITATITAAPETVE